MYKDANYFPKYLIMRIKTDYENKMIIETQT